MASLEVKWNAFDWRGDTTKKMPRVHPFSLKNPIHGTVLSFGKLLVVGAQVWFGSNHPVKVLVFMICVFVALCVMSFDKPPYSDPRANAIRYFLDFGVVWVHCATLIF